MTAALSDLVVVSNRLPIDVSVSNDGSLSYRRSPGGLVTALEPVLAQSSGAWVGWPGAPDFTFDPVLLDGIWSVPVTLSGEEVT